MKILLLSSGNGSSNLGDETMFFAARQVILDCCADVRIVTDGPAGWGEDLERTTVVEFPHLALRRGQQMGLKGLLERLVSYPARDARALHEALKSDFPSKWLRTWGPIVRGADCVVFAGAGAINDDFAGHGIAAWSMIAKLCKRYGKKYALVGQGIGPVSSAKGRELAEGLLNGATLLTVRDHQSASWAKELAPKSHPVVTADWAVVDEPTAGDRQRAKAILARYLDSSASHLSIVSLHRRHNTTREMLAQVGRVVENIMGNVPGRILFVSNMTGPGYSDDRATARIVLEGLSEEFRARSRVVDEVLSGRETRALIGLASRIVTTRYHPAIFALAEGVPVVGVAYDEYYRQKLFGAMRWSRNEHLVVEMAEAEGWIEGTGIDMHWDTPDLDAQKETITRPLVEFLREVGCRA